MRPRPRPSFAPAATDGWTFSLVSWTHAILCAVWRLPTDDTATTPLLWAQRQYLLHQLREAA